jgi:RHS repeat-associated protein
VSGHSAKVLLHAIQRLRIQARAASRLHESVSFASTNTSLVATPQPVNYSGNTSGQTTVLTNPVLSSTPTKTIAYSYLWFGDLPVASVDVSNTTRWYTTDHLGTPLLMTDTTGTIVWRAEHSPYGTIYTYRAGATLHQPLRLPGQTAQDGNDAYYNIFRWYRAGWGRYTQADPMALGDDDAYGYASGGPTGSSDRFGLYTVRKIITTRRTMNPDQICGSPFACSLVGAAVACQCNCSASGYSADATVFVQGTIYYFSGPFGAIKKKPKDPTVKDSATAIAHEYNYHIDPGIDSIDPLMRNLEGTSFVSIGDCRRGCSALSLQVAAQFAATLRETQAAENK